MVRPDFPLCLSLYVCDKMFTAEVLPGILLAENRIPPALIAPHERYPVYF
jgi:hypothetical protein